MPWFHDALRKHPDELKHLGDCKTCMETLPRDTRLMIGCGFEPAVPGALPWQPPIAKLGYRHDRPKQCPGYTTRLPEVIEVARAHTHWDKGELRSFCGGNPHENLVACVELLDAELQQLKVYATTPTDEGGGRE